MSTPSSNPGARALGAAVLIGLAAVMVGCTAAGVGDGGGASLAAPYLDHDEPSDFAVDEDGKADGVPSTFDRNRILEEELFLHGDALSADDVQIFLEQSPYDQRCFLADETVDGFRFSDVLTTTAASARIHPLVLLARMQVERSLVSKQTRPSESTLDHALGCGCPDGSGCARSYEGLAAQLECAAEVFGELHELSVEGTGTWIAGRTRTSLDGYSVKPANHATAAMYGYTPWVLPKTGGNWLVWNVTRKFVRHATELELDP